jgi:hypothetical protein
LLPKRFLLLAVLLTLSALALSACGGGGDDAEGKIEEAIETSATTSDPTNCTEFETENFAEQSSGASGAAAVKACEAEQKDPEGKAESVAVSKVEVDGSKATANAAVSGGSLDNQTIEVALVEEDGQWKLDELAGFAKFDRASLVEVFETQLKKTSELSAEQANCIVAGIEEAPQPEVEALVLDARSNAIEEIAEGCE